nr:hypothetical protein [Lentzea indica]
MKLMVLNMRSKAAHRAKTGEHISQAAIDASHRTADLAKLRTHLLDLDAKLAQFLFRTDVAAAITYERTSVRLDLHPSLFPEQADTGHSRVDRDAFVCG